MTQQDKSYATNFFRFPIKEEIVSSINRVIKDAASEGEMQAAAKNILNHQYALFREMHGLDCVIGYATVEGENDLYVILFENIKSEEGNYYSLFYEEEKARHYIEVPA